MSRPESKAGIPDRYRSRLNLLRFGYLLSFGWRERNQERQVSELGHRRLEAKPALRHVHLLISMP